MSESSLRQIAREALRRGLLPDVFVRNFRGGDGKGETCHLCQLEILTTHLLACVELESHSHCFHMPCFLMWQAVISHPRGAPAA